MPIFVFKCSDCGAVIEELMKEKESFIICSKCSAKANAQITAHSFTPSRFGDFAKTYNNEFKGKKD